jgi:hypothetical protein
LEVELFPQVFITDKAANENTVVELTTEDGAEYRLRFNGEEDELSFDRLISIERDGNETRNEKLHIFTCSKSNGNNSSVEYVLDLGIVNHNVDENEDKIPDGEVFTTKPLFCLLTEKNITLEKMEDFERIQF